MAKRKYTAEEIVTVLRQVQVEAANGKSTPQACRQARITEQTYNRGPLSCTALTAGCEAPSPLEQPHDFRPCQRIEMQIETDDCCGRVGVHVEFVDLHREDGE